MNYNPRKIALAAVTALAVGLPLTACGSTSTAPVQTPTYEAPEDCDLDDLEQGDADCNDPVAFAAAVRKHGSKKVADAKRKYAEKVAKEKERKARENIRKRVESVTPPVVRKPAAAPAPAPVPATRTNSTKTTSGGSKWKPFSKRK